MKNWRAEAAVLREDRPNGGLALCLYDGGTRSQPPGLSARDIVGSYLEPPERALVQCVDEKSQIQALDRSQPMLPIWSGEIERRKSDSYVPINPLGRQQGASISICLILPAVCTTMSP